MGRNLVCCLDGTSNRFCDHNTSVVKIFSTLKIADDEQLGYYDAGVGVLAETPGGLFTKIGNAVDANLDYAFAR
jgi:uncharacterized protein (DUF2235 family)